MFTSGLMLESKRQASGQCEVGFGVANPGAGVAEKNKERTPFGIRSLDSLAKKAVWFSS